MSKLGSKIVVLGVSASGKSTFARRLGEKTGLPVTHIDALMWKPGWQYIGDEETVRLITEISQGDQWIIEGYIDKNAQLALFQKADQLLYLDYPGWLSAYRYVKRFWQHRKKPRPELHGSPDTFSLEFLHRVYTKREVYRLEKLFKEVDFSAKLTRFKHPKDMEIFLQSL